MSKNFEYFKLTPFKWFILENFPFIEADFDALTNYELFCKIGKEMNKIIDKVNLSGEQVEALTEFINNFFDNLDLQDEVNNKLDEMVQDGTLAEIINNEIFEELNNKINKAMLKTDNQAYNNLTLERFLRTFIRNGNHPEHVAGQDFATLQGGCYSGNDKMILCQNRSDTNNMLVEISLIDGSVIRQSQMNLGHGNSVAYNTKNNKLYIAGLTNNAKHSIFVVDYTSLTLENTLIFNDLPEEEQIHSVSYDIVTDKMYIMTETTPTNFITLYELNIQNNILSKIELQDYDNTLSTTNNNDMCVYNNIIYIMKYNPQVIITYNVETKELQNLYNINNETAIGIPVGELENISIMYDKERKDILISSNRIECQNGFYNMFQFYKANATYNVKKPILLNNNLPQQIFVDINSSSINPNGSSSNPFKHISEAFEICNSRKNTNITITEGTYPFANIYGLKGRIQAGGTNIIINGLSINLCDYIYLYGITVNNINALQSYDIYVESSKVRFSNVALSETENANFDIHNSTIELNNVQNIKFNSRAENNIICYDDIPDYKVMTGKKPNINKPVKLCNGNLSHTTDTITYNLTDNPILFNSPNLKLRVHANYAYTDILIPNLTSNGTRLFSVFINNWLMNITLTRTDTTIALHILTCKNVAGNNVVDNTNTASGDFTLYADN